MIWRGRKIPQWFQDNIVGSYLPKIWLDEFPMLVNYSEGDMKACRCETTQQIIILNFTEKRSRETDKVQTRTVPPFYADMPADLEAIQASELNYLDHFDKHPFLTDFRYFWSRGGIFCSGKRDRIRVVVNASWLLRLKQHPRWPHAEISPKGEKICQLFIRISLDDTEFIPPVQRGTKGVNKTADSPFRGTKGVNKTSR